MKRHVSKGYEGIRKSKFDKDVWNVQGRYYNLKALYNLSKTKGLELLLNDGIKKDLETYEMQREKRLSVYREEGLAMAQQN
ncbi:MAG TPA: hypothetical protein ENI61_02730 [Ignavibacteria bacterium]|nr:hypothetical protein [Ignavibacteria bacterium]